MALIKTGRSAVSLCLTLHVLLMAALTARAQEGCMMNSLMLQSSLSDIIGNFLAPVGDTPGDPPEVTVYDQNVVCLVTTQTRDQYSFASVVALFSCTGNLGIGNPLGSTCATGNYTVQFDVECRGDAPNLSWQESQTPISAFGSGSTLFNPPDANFNTPLDSFCSLCFDPGVALPMHPVTGQTIFVDPITHCAACNDSCLESPAGQELCYGIASPGNSRCCNVFENDMCEESCSPGRQPQIQADGKTLVCELVCDDLPDPANGLISYSPLGFPFLDTVATYSCIEGYEVSSPSTQTCVDGPESTVEWSPSAAPTCTIVDCGPLNDTENGQVLTPNGTTFGEVAIYSCVGNNTALVGDETRTCQANGQWSAEEPTCVVDCGPLNDTENGQVLTPNGTTFGEVAIYSCTEGLAPVEDETRTCQANGQWSAEEPTCVIDCGPLGDPSHGQVVVNDTTFGAEATYSCDSEFTLHGSDRRICMESGWTQDAPLCVRICTKVLPNPVNGNVETFMEPPSWQANYQCDAGYALKGTVLRSCDNEGVWAGDAPTCEALDCGVLSNPENGEVDTPGGTQFQAVATYTCDSGFEVFGDKERTCQKTGQWSGVEPVCIITLSSIDDEDNFEGADIGLVCVGAAIVLVLLAVMVGLVLMGIYKNRNDKSC